MPSADAIYWIADRLAPTMRRQFLASVGRLQTRITIRSIETAVGMRGWPTSMARAFDTFEQELRQTAGTTLDTVWLRTAQQVEGQVLKRAGLVGRFDLVNPLAIQAAQERSSLLIRSISSETRRAIQQVISQAHAKGIPPRLAAQQIRPMIGLTPRQMATVTNYRNNLLAAGAPQRQAVKASADYAKKLLRERSITIARTETIRSSVDGQQDVWLHAKFDNIIGDDAVQQWIVADDERLCPICSGLNGTTAPIERGASFGDVTGPPAHPRCRCALVLVYNSPKRRR